MKYKFTLAARLLLGLIFAFFGSNGLAMSLTGHGFLPMPEPGPEMMIIMTGFLATNYLLGLVAAVQTFSGLLLVSGRYVNLAITLLGPIIVNILCIHIFADPSGLPVAVVVTALWLVLLRARWSDFKTLVKKD
ncbi:MAG: hypothetical protein COV44_06900 [Deltaproteobacteria bacterium CG11_big_fil_rev_8_21_14_0_20_45_16]|nr:MAG: hypothetical protein COV44_06900 [Deltaproteobacteria bacterium CG11_big_fil_rev_8_21_14_0_20_45_16]